MEQERVRKALHYSWVVVLIAALYVAWVFYSRHEQALAAEREAAKQKQEEAKRVNNLIFGSGELQFTTFSADSGVLQPGETTELCYGVVNAVRVELDPPIEQAKPTYRHCIEIAPKKTTTYTIKATDAKGNTKSQSLTVQVR
jgi:methylase of polypeptide subunit release factors